MNDKFVAASDVATAFSLLTRLPVPVDRATSADRAAAAVWAWPLTGMAIGLMGGLTAHVLWALGVNSGLSALAAIGTMVLVTGGLHEDGLADTADGLGPDVSREQRFEIMKDSRVGSFAVIALALALMARWGALSQFHGWQLTGLLVAAAAGSRSLMAAAMAIVPPARQTGLSAMIGRPRANAALLGLAIALFATLRIMGWPGMIALLVAMLAALPVLMLAQRRLGGQTGDILGAAQICAEIGFLVAATAMLQ